MATRKKRNWKLHPADLSKLKVDTSELDPWQLEVFKHKGNIAIRAGRQVGKSFTMAKKAAQFALQNQNVHILVIAASERQAGYIYEKIKLELQKMPFDVFDGLATMRKISLKNGSNIYCMPTGKTGDLIRGLTIDILIPDEAAYIPPMVWVSLIPMLHVARMERNFGWIWALSTPCGDSGHFYEFFKDPDFKTWHISAYDCPRQRKEDLDKFKRTMTKKDFMQEILAEFISDIEKFFPTEIIKACSKWKIEKPNGKNFLGVDVARYGKDENAFVSGTIDKKRKLDIWGAETSERVSIPRTRRKIEGLHDKWKYKKMYIDDGGVGGGLYDELEERFGEKVEALNNAKRVISKDRKKTALKLDMYSNALRLMERTYEGFKEGVRISKDLEELLISLDGIKYKYNDDGTIKIYGKNTHLAEAFIRCCWSMTKKNLKLFAHVF